MYAVESGQYLERFTGVKTYPEYTSLNGLEFLMTNTKTIKITGGLSSSRRDITSEVQPGVFVLADTGTETSQIRRVELFDRASGTIQLDQKFTLTAGVSYDLKIIPNWSKTLPTDLVVSFFSDSDYQLAINGTFIPRRTKAKYAINRDRTYPFVLFCTGEYIVSEASIIDIGTSDEIYSSSAGYCKIYYYNSSDPAIQDVDAKHKKFPILAGKTIHDFAIALLGSILIQNCDDQPTANEVKSIDTNGVVLFKNNQPAQGVYLIIVKI